MKPSHNKPQDSDAASLASVSTFASTVALLKEKVHTSHKEHKSSKEPSKEGEPKKIMLAAVVNGDYKTRTLTPVEQQKMLEEFILMTK